MRIRTVALLPALASIVLATIATPVHAVSQVVFTVNAVNDSGDAAIDGLCETTLAGQCTLRAAMTEARVSSVPVLINFAIPGAGVHTITPGINLPPIDNQNAPLTIDGSTQPGSTLNTDPFAMNTVFGIEIRGQGGSTFNGFTVTSPNNVFRGFDLHGFRKQLYFSGPNSHHNVIAGVVIGLSPDGAYDSHHTLNPGSSCVELISGAHDNHIGLPGEANRNVVSGCDQKGIALYNIGTKNNWIQNNIVGLDPTGTQRRGTISHGVDINTGATFTMVGGLGFQERNVISGNFQSGVEISHNATTNYNSVVGNSIGTDLSGTTFSAATVNSQIGVRLEGNANCNNAVCPVDEGFETVTDNVIVNSTLAGLYIDKGVHDSLIARNLIGVLPDGSAAPNVGYGVRIEAGSNRITLSDNRIAFNGKGIQIAATGAQPANLTPSPTNGIQLLGNLIYGNGSLQIDIAPWGAANDATRGNAFVNDDIRIPKLNNATTTSITVATCAGCAVELFLATSASGYGGAIGSIATGTANSNGLVVIAIPLSTFARPVTAIATNPAAGSSEYAKNVIIPGG